MTMNLFFYLFYSLDPVETFTNLKRLRLTRINDLLYFCSSFQYKFQMDNKFLKIKNLLCKVKIFLA